MDRSTISMSTTPGTVAHLVSSAGSLHYLLLLSRSAHSSFAQHAHGRLCELVTQRIFVRATAQVASLGLDAETTDAEVSRLMQSAIELVLPAVTAFRVQSRQNFAEWLDRRIDDALRGEPLDGPPTATVPLRAAVALEHLPIPHGERHAVLAAILRQLPTPERRVLQHRAEPRASWSRVAQTMGMTVGGVRALHRRALERAQQIAFDIVQPTHTTPNVDMPRAA